MIRIIVNPPETNLFDIREILSTDTEREITDILVSINPFYIVAEDGGCTVGIASISMGDGAAELYKMYVSPLYRRRGVAQALFIELLRVLRNRNIEELYVETITSAGRAFLQAVTSEFEVQHLHGDKFSVLI